MNILGNLSIADSVIDFNTSPELQGAAAVKTLVLGGITYVYVTGYYDNGIQILKLDEDGSLTPVGSFEDTASIHMSRPTYFDIAKVGNTYFLVVPGQSDDGLTTLKVTASGPNQGQLALADTIANGGGNALDYADKVQVFETANGTFAAVSAYYSDAVSIYRISGDGTMTLVDVALDTEDSGYKLGGAYGLTTMDIGTKTYLYVGSQDEDGIMVFELNNNGTMSFVSVLGVGSIDMHGIEAGTFNGKDYLILTDSNDGAFKIYTIGNDGIPVFANNFNGYAASGNLMWQNTQLDIIEVDGVDFIISQGNRDDSVTVYTINDSDQMEIVQTIRDPLLNGANDVEYVQIGDRHFILVAAFDGNRITAVEIGGGDDPVVGTLGDDKIIGLAGDDDLIGRDGNDLIKGGMGADVLSGRKGNDKLYGGGDRDILIGGNGNDILEGGDKGDFLIGGYGADRASYTLSDAAVNVNLATGAASGGDAQGDFLDSIENLTGSRFSDTLTGDDARNVILGGNGGDVIIGGGGNDTLDGQKGNDDLQGGSGNDKLIMGAGADKGAGGDGNDTINGGGGRDLLDGGNGNDTLIGGAGNDRLLGGAGDDKLTGGAGADIFIFETASGGDTVQDFDTAADRIDFKAHSGFNSFADVLAGSFEFQGSTVIGGGANSIQLIGVAKADLSADDFIF